MRTEQDYRLVEDDDVWTRKRNPLDPVYSDPRPDYLMWILNTALVALCLAVIMALLFLAVG